MKKEHRLQYLLAAVLGKVFSVIINTNPLARSPPQEGQGAHASVTNSYYQPF